jgi:hypothetical protein
VLATLPAHNAAVLTGTQFFPHLIAGPFHHGLIIVFTAAAIMSVVGAAVSLMRGGQFYYDAPDGPGPAAPPAPATAARGPQPLNGTSRHTTPAGRESPPGAPARPGLPR